MNDIETGNLTPPPTENAQGEQTQKAGDGQEQEKTEFTKLGDQLVTRMNMLVSGSSGNSHPFDGATFFSLNLLLAGGYTFSRILLETVLALNACATTTKRLDIVCNIIRRCWTGDKYTDLIDTIQKLYDSTEYNSLPELHLGSLLQRLTDKLPRKVGPERNMLFGRQFITDESAGDICLSDPAQKPETPPTS
jgi:hypothetical protein